MSDGPRRGVTRGYVGALILAAVIVCVALLIAAWGGLTLALSRPPVATESVPVWAAPLVLFLALGMLAAALWGQALTLLRGRRSPAWGQLIAVAAGAYLLWGLGGSLAGMDQGDAWFSPFGGIIPIIWLLAQLLFWAVLARRVYTDRPPPRWPWERAEDEE
ncbi:hypothetical protein [Leucobacter chromiireducens]|uniref:Uncharacterized protein n=1 Tax=Leucobacter chromiireducens subsp. chromiireducens TaxID=660067 RepID=A0ABS1SLI0_9MICO|nr:hypothetical protein [Leucobacter chromiireducens]MBL3689009.1 hypothetical protein [Leucobacter chromiireducens subsp. chromiireducens]